MQKRKEGEKRKKKRMMGRNGVASLGKKRNKKRGKERRVHRWRGESDKEGGERDGNVGGYYCYCYYNVHREVGDLKRSGKKLEQRRKRK